MRISRRNVLSAMAMGALGITHSLPLRGEGSNLASKFRYCLNTSTISGQNPGLLKYIEIASKAGYDGIEVWVRDVEDTLNAGHSLSSLKRFIEDHGLQVESAIGFAPWMTDGEKYHRLLDLGRLTGVMPQLEFWGSSPVLWHLGQVLMIAAVADDPDVKILPEVYHMFRGGTGFETLKMLNGSVIDLFHMNDYPASKPREQQDDADRIYPGDGVAPMRQILTDLKNMGGDKVLSLELFNRAYWGEDPKLVAKTGLDKMKSLVGEIA